MYGRKLLTFINWRFNQYNYRKIIKYFLPPFMLQKMPGKGHCSTGLQLWYSFTQTYCKIFVLESYSPHKIVPTKSRSQFSWECVRQFETTSVQPSEASSFMRSAVFYSKIWMKSTTWFLLYFIFAFKPYARKDGESPWWLLFEVLRE